MSLIYVTQSSSAVTASDGDIVILPDVTQIPNNFSILVHISNKIAPVILRPQTPQKIDGVSGDTTLPVDGNTKSIFLSTLEPIGWTTIDTFIPEAAISASSGALSIQTLTTSGIAGIASLVKLDASLGSFTASLPTAVGNSGLKTILKKIDSSSNTILIDPNGSETIDGASTFTIFVQHQSLSLISDGANWIVE
jgi:hypothetical protein